MADANLNENLDIVAQSNLDIQLLDGDLNIIQKLDDEPNDVGGMTSAELKATFDKAGNIIKGYINETLIPAILADDATEAARAAAEAARETAESERAAAETARETAEQARAAAETARAAAETQRANAESLRASAESSRATAETARVNAESARETAEAARAAAEQTRADENTGIVARATEQADLARSAAASAGNSATAAAASKSAAASAANSAAGSAAAASDSETNAKASETAAKESETTAKSEADRAKSEADRATEIVGGDFVKSSEKGAANGVATLGTDGKVPESQLPEISAVKIYTATIGTTWTENENTGVKSQSIAIAGVLAKHTAKVDHAYTGDGTSDGYAAFVEAENQYLTYITNGYAETYDGGITFYIFGDAPTVSIPIAVEVA